MTEELPAPLVASDVDLRGYSSFMLDVDRFLASELAALATPEEGWAAFFLWCRAWKQSPPGSLPDDDRVLASFSNTGKRWPKVRAVALRGFVQCNDGRLYHRVLCEEVNAGWKRRQEHDRKRATDAKRLQKWRDEQDAKREGNAHETRFNAATSHSDRTGQYRTGQDRTGQDRSSKATSTPRSKPLTTPEKAREIVVGEEDGRTIPTWNAYSTAYTRRYGTEPTRNGKSNGLLAQLVKRLGAEEAPLVAAFYLSHNAQRYAARTHSLDLLVLDAEGLRTQWARRTAFTESEARMGDKTAARGNVFEEVRRELKDAS